MRGSPQRSICRSASKTSSWSLPGSLRRGTKLNSPHQNWRACARRSITCWLQEPFPGVVVDRHWNLLKANQGALWLVEFLVGPVAPDAQVNLADALVGPDVFRPYLVNWAEIARYFIRSVEADAAVDGTAETSALLERLLAYDGVRPLLRAIAVGDAADPVLPMHFRKGEVSLDLFTTIATLGTPQDVTLQELRIENFFPMNDDTAAILRAWASRTS